jgi:transposase-like protein
MTLPGECVNNTKTTCHECGAHLEIKVGGSMAGYYVGFWCESCGSYSRESGYYRSYEEAEKALSSNSLAPIEVSIIKASA